MHNSKKTLVRNFFQDPFNPYKIWEVVSLKGGYYLRQYIKGIQFGRGTKVSKSFLNDIGILSFEKIDKLG